MDERTRRWVEAALDPRGKWYGRPSPNWCRPALQDVLPLADDGGTWSDVEAEPEIWLQDHDAAVGDEWTPA